MFGVRVLWPVLTAAAFLGSGAAGVAVRWKSCPKIELGAMANNDCDLGYYSWQLRPLAHIPGGQSSINPFHNPYGTQSCARFLFYCRKDNFILGDLYIIPREQPRLVCPGFSLYLEDSAWKVKMYTNPLEKKCQTVRKWVSVDALVYRQAEYIFMFGCWQLGEGQPVLIGGWILGDANATATKQARALQSAREIALKIPGFRDEWWNLPQENEQCFRNGTCDYLTACETTEEVEQALEPLSEVVQSVYFIVGLLVFMSIVIIARLVYKYATNNKIEPMYQVGTH